MSIRSGQTDLKNFNDWIFFIINKKPFFYALFLTSPVAMATGHTLTKMRE